MFGTCHEREPRLMLHGEANYKVKETRPRVSSRTKWLKDMDNQLNEKQSRMKDLMSQYLCQDRRAFVN